MRLNDYVIWTDNTRSTMGSIQLDNHHMLMGMNTEIGELYEALSTSSPEDVDKVNLGEEVGDFMWYVAGFCRVNNLNLEEIIGNENYRLAQPPMVLSVIKVAQLTDIFKKNLAYKKDIDWNSVKKIIQSLVWCIWSFCQMYSIDFNEAVNLNVKKLEARYPNKFTEFHALNRNLNEERKILES